MTATAERRPVTETHPYWFGRVVLQRDRWQRQREIRRSLWENRRTLVYSANSVGKTFELGSSIVEWVVSHPGSRTIITGPKFDAVKRGVWQQVRAAYFGAKTRLPGDMQMESWTLADGWDCFICTADSPSSLQGVRGSTVLLVIDEAQGMENREFITALLSLVTATESRVIVTGNMLFTAGWFYEAAQSPLYNVISIDGLEHPNIVHGEEIHAGAITQQWVDEMREEFGEDSPEYQSRVRGRIPSESTSQVINLNDFAKGGILEKPEDPRGGLDVARFGGDRNVFVAFDEHRRLAHVESWTGLDLMQTAGRAKNLAHDHGIKRLRVDVCGLGAGVYDRLREEKVPVMAVDFGEGPKGDWSGVLGRTVSFKNRRAECHWVTRTLLRGGNVDIPERFREVRSDLVAPRYTYDGSGAIVVEEKDKIRARIGRSPDFGDAVHIAMAGGVGGFRF